MTEPLVLSRPYRPKIKATKQSDGSLIIRSGPACVRLDAEQLQELYAYAAGKPTIQRYPAMAPRSTQAGE